MAGAKYFRMCKNINNSCGIPENRKTGPVLKPGLTDFFQKKELFQ
jgi:hypothetical protein